MTTGAIFLTQKKSLGNIIDDNILISKIRCVLLKKNNLYYKVNAKVFEGRVLLTGFVFSADDKNELEEMIWSIIGVKEVLNQVFIKDKISNFTVLSNQLLSNAWIKLKLKSRLIIASKTNSLNYKVVVCNNTVYLIGVASDQIELKEILNSIKLVKGISAIKNYIIYAGDARRNTLLY